MDFRDFYSFNYLFVIVVIYFCYFEIIFVIDGENLGIEIKLVESFLLGLDRKFFKVLILRLSIKVFGIFFFVYIF